ncbi:MAG: RNA-binding protein [Acidobacteria bacterium]|nr:RNA-binding protein [Acidobacteriota bacterium]
MGRKLFVGNLPFQTTEEELHGLFSQADTVETVTVMRDQMTGRARGFAFVEMSTDEGAQKAIEQLNNHELGGRALAVNEARPKVSSGGGFGAGGGGGRGGRGGGGGFGGGGGGRRREPRW